MVIQMYVATAMPYCQKPNASDFDEFLNNNCYMSPYIWTPLHAVHSAFHDYCRGVTPRPHQRPGYKDIIEHLNRHELETKGTKHFPVVIGLQITKWP
jgi:hypothetical protein